MSELTHAYVLAKNETPNIARCLASLAAANLAVTVLDSGSTDGTQEVAAGFANVEVRPWEYRNHCDSYNRILTSHPPGTHVAILDADMQLPLALTTEVRQIVAADPPPDAIKAPVLMYWDGEVLRYGSLYPPKPIVFKTGQALFEPVGHGEHLRSGLNVVLTKAQLIHDDRKPLETVLANQWRYAKEVVRRSRSQNLTWRDRLRIRTPLMIFLVPTYALIVRRALFAGKTGWIYALDRLISEALKYRASLSSTVKHELDSDTSPTPPLGVGEPAPRAPQCD